MTEEEELSEDTKDSALGLGDVVSKITGALRIPECGGCKRRKKWLNKVRIPRRRK